MAYSDFTDIGSLSSLGVCVQETTQDIVISSTISTTSFLKEALHRFVPLAAAIDTEKARSEYIIAPILSKLATQNEQLSLFSGRNFNVDAEQGLVGFCDFILTRNPDKLSIKSPVVIIFEAKNENINSGLAQCIAAMVAAQIQNQREGSSDEAIYGVVTTGQVWRFLRLDPNKHVLIDLKDRYLTPIEELLGALTAMACPIS
ncbi:MAG: hypothetical protein AAFU71_09175 [Cyanobacteria bacterium J06632_22]